MSRKLWGRLHERADGSYKAVRIGSLSNSDASWNWRVTDIFVGEDTAPTIPQVAEVPDPYFGVQDEVYLTRAVSVMNDVLTDIAGWEDKALAKAVESSKVDLCAMIECIRMRADDSYVPGSKPIDGETFDESEADRSKQ